MAYVYCTLVEPCHIKTSFRADDSLAGQIHATKMPNVNFLNCDFSIETNENDRICATNAREIHTAVSIDYYNIHTEWFQRKYFLFSSTCTSYVKYRFFKRNCYLQSTVNSQKRYNGYWFKHIYFKSVYIIQYNFQSYKH